MRWGSLLSATCFFLTNIREENEMAATNDEGGVRPHEVRWQELGRRRAGVGARAVGESGMTSRHPRVPVLILAGAAIATAMLAACGGDSGSDETPRATATAASGAPTVVSGAPTVPAAAESECTIDSPKNLRSTSHQPNVATTTQVIDMAWDSPSTLPASYTYAFSQNPQEPPDVMESLPGVATSVSSGPQGQNNWYFYLVQAGGETAPTRCGPYVITR
jgi:hypothetical protein